MSSAALMTRDTVTVKCPDCGGGREVSIRQRRRLTNQDGDFRCSVCRTIQLPAVVEVEDLDFWINTYSQEWIKETAAMIWGDDL